MSLKHYDGLPCRRSGVECMPCRQVISAPRMLCALGGIDHGSGDTLRLAIMHTQHLLMTKCAAIWVPCSCKLDWPELCAKHVLLKLFEEWLECQRGVRLLLHASSKRHP